MPTNPIRVSARIQVTMMAKVISAVSPCRNQIRPSKKCLGHPIIKSSISKQSIVDTVVHQN